MPVHARSLIADVEPGVYDANDLIETMSTADRDECLTAGSTGAGKKGIDSSQSQAEPQGALAEPRHTAGHASAGLLSRPARAIDFPRRPNA